MQEPDTRRVTGEKMEIPVRCFTCGKTIGHKYKKYKQKISKGKTKKKALDEIGLEKYCCRRMILSHKDLIDEVKNYRKY